MDDYGGSARDSTTNLRLHTENLAKPNAFVPRSACSALKLFLNAKHTVQLL